MDSPEDNKKYWEQRYINGETGWDTGCISAPLKAYIDQLTNKNLRILIPGCGSAYEAQYLHDQGFSNVVVVDLVQLALDRLTERSPNFPMKHIVRGDFFTHEGQYDLILEQTFLSSIDPRFRPAYVKKIHSLLTPNGKLSGVLFDFELDGGPPYGGSINEYESNFKLLFDIHTLEPCYNSSATWQDLELFIILNRKT